MTETPEILEVCPGPGCHPEPVKGPKVYLSDAHPITCDWMMSVARRCGQHDELLRPDEPECPAPDVPEEAEDPHGRTN